MTQPVPPPPPAVQAAIINQIRQNFNSLNRAERAHIGKLITPHLIKVVSMVLGPDVGKFFAEYEAANRPGARRAGIIDKAKA